MKEHQQVTGQRSANRRPMILALIIVGILALPFLAENVANGSLGLSAATRSTKNGAITQIKDLHPFKHLASIPEGWLRNAVKFDQGVESIGTVRSLP